MKLSEINIRDPFILPFRGRYYMYGSRVGIQTGFDVYTSCDLENWSDPISIFEKNDGFWAVTDFWAPEVHLYNGKFYMFASFRAPGRCRGTQILVCDTPDGTFQPVSADPVTPADWECLDGTLYIDGQNKPHIVFCHEWLQIGNGTVCEMELARDLSHPVSEPRLLWSASDYPHVAHVLPDRVSYVTDGPFLHRCENGDLVSIWSTYDKNGYVELLAKSDNGDIDGNWTVCATPISAEDGGHGMIFTDLDGKLRISLHSPNGGFEYARFLHIKEDGDFIKIV